MSVWSKRAISELLRYGRKNEGGWSDGFDDGERMPDDGDASLISAAPELLAALKCLLDADEREAIKAINQAIAAIAKAEAE